MKALIRLKNPTAFSFFFCNFSSFKSTPLIASPRAPAIYLTFSPDDLMERSTEQASARFLVGSAFSSNNLPKSIPDFKVKLN